MKKFLLSSLNPNSLLTLPVFLITLAWGIITNLLDRVFNPEGFYFERLSAVVGGWLVMFFVIWLGVLALKLLPRVAQSLLMIPVIIIASISRGLTVWAVLFNFELDTLEVFNYRVFGPITNMGIPLLLTAIAVHRIRTFTQVRSSLLAETSRLTELIDLAQDQLKADTEVQLEEIRATVGHALSLNQTTTVSETMRAISSTIDDVVRPLTDAIEANASESSREVEVPNVRLNWREAVLGSLSAKFLKPVSVAGLLFIAAIGFLSSSHTPQETLSILAISSISSWSLLALLKVSLERISESVSVNVSRVLFLLGIVLTGVLVGIASLPVTLTTKTPLSVVFLGPYVVTGLTLLFALAASSQVQARAANERLEELRKKLAWEVARVSNEQRQLRKAVAALLHGKLQSGLTSALMKLKMTQASDPSNLEQVGQEVQKDLRELVESVTLQESDAAKSIRELVLAIQQTWQGVAVITLDEIDELATRKLESDAVLVRNIAEILAELSFNAIKHGDATNIRFSIRENSLNTVLLTSIDNGSRTPASGRIGLGTRLLDECALEWKREANQDGSGTRTVVLLTFSPAIRHYSRQITDRVNPIISF